MDGSLAWSWAAGGLSLLLAGSVVPRGARRALFVRVEAIASLTFFHAAWLVVVSHQSIDSHNSNPFSS